MRVFDPHCDILIGFNKFGIQPLLPSPKPHTCKNWTSDEDISDATSTATAAVVTETPTAWLFFFFCVHQQETGDVRAQWDFSER